MANASYVQDSFLGGEKSQLAQGRIFERDYRTWMNVCLNGHPVEGGGWVRRSGTMYGAHTRSGKNGRVIKWDFAQATPYTMEFTDGFIRFRVGTQLAFTNDTQTVLGISAANPAVVQTANPSGWATGNTVMLAGLGAGMPLLQNRQFTITIVDPTHFSLADALTSATIDGSTLGAFPAGTVTVSRVQEVASPYTGGNWSTLRAVQAETNAVLLQATIPPQLLTATPPIGTNNAVFNLASLTLLDGPYFDPPINGVQAVPSALSGNITITLAFPTFNSTKAYKIGDFVTSASTNYVSLIDSNVGNTPAGSPSAWQATSAGAAINNGKGFLGTDVGRLVRLFSEPAPWNAATPYVAGNIVSYNPSGAPGASSYWTALVNNTGKIPGNDSTNWALTPANAAIWSWGKIISLGNQTSQLAGTAIGNATSGGGIAAAFDGVITQNSNQASTLVVTTTITNSGNLFHALNYSQPISVDAFVGKTFTGGQQIGSATLFGSTDLGVMFATQTLTAGFSPSTPGNITGSMTLNLRAKQTAPAFPSDGTLLGTTGNVIGSVITAGQTQTISVGSFTINSNDPVTAWNYIWVEAVINVTMTGTLAAGSSSGHGGASATMTVADSFAEVQFFAPPGTGSSGNAVNVEILGPPLLYTNPCITWRLGAYSNTTGWPTNGAYHEGRIWLAGAIGNRFDASVSNGLVGTTLNMAPTDQNGVVGISNAITGTMNSDSVNPIFWMTPDLQGIIAGTQAGEWLIFAPSTGAIAPNNVSARRVTKIGCANVEPRKTDHTNVFVQRYTRKVMEYFTDVYSGKFAAPNLAKDSLHITKPGIAEIAYTSAVVPIVWGRNADGSWWGTTYKRDTLATSQGPTVNGWHRHALGSGRSVQSICAGPSTGGNLDALTFVTFDSGTGVYHVEVMTDIVDEGNTLLQATYVDDAANPTSVSSSSSVPAPFGGLTLNGLWHLNGKTVTAWLGGLDCGDFTVANGSITVPYGDGISAGPANGLFTAAYAATLSLSQMLVGFTFTSQGQIVRPATPQESGARNGPAVGKKRRNHQFAVQLEGTGIGLAFGTTFPKVDPARLRLPNDTALLLNQQFTGVHVDTITDDNSYDGMLCWQQNRPLPVNIANVGGFIETVDK